MVYPGKQLIFDMTDSLVEGEGRGGFVYVGTLKEIEGPED